MRRLLVALATVAVFGCSSGNFEVAPGSGTDAAVPDTSGTDANVDSAPPSECADTPGVAKVCVTLKVDPTHPGYDGPSGAGSIGLDGKGYAWVGIYDQDPLVPKKATPPPIASLRSPTATADLALEKLPITLSTTIAKGPGTYWIVAQFLDNAVSPRTPGPDQIAVGDYALIPGIDSTTKLPAYPTIKVESGKTTIANFTLSPYYGLRVAVSASKELRAEAVLNPEIHGDGPIAFLFYDGDLGTKPVFIGSDVTPCVNLALRAPVVATKSVLIRSAANGMHKLLSVLIDYDLWGSDSSSNEFPGRGGIAAGLAGDLTADIRTNVWISDTAISFPAPVYKPYKPTDTGTDKFACTP